MKPERLHKHTIVIWRSADSRELELEDLAREADRGDAFCSHHGLELVTDQSQFPDTEFFDLPDPEPYPKPWKIGFRPVEGATVYASNGAIVPWEIATVEMNKEKPEVPEKLTIDEDNEDFPIPESTELSNRIWDNYYKLQKRRYG